MLDTEITQSQILDLGSDVELRRKWFVEASFSHPAKLHLGLLNWIVERHTRPGQLIIDPMCGIGSVLLAATKQRNVIARDVEPPWLELAHQNAANIHRLSGFWGAGSIEVGQADARKPWSIAGVDCIITSPPYACAISATDQTRKGILSKRERKLARLEKVALSTRWERLIKNPSHGAVAYEHFFYGNHPDQIGHLRNGSYWKAMSDIYRQAHNSLNGGGK